jgi:two-component system cell cycle sensor histidine kinase/response regulator CckA
MRSNRPPDHPDYDKLTQIEEAAEAAAKLAHQLLTFARGGKIRPRLLPFADVIESAFVLVPPLVPHNVVVDRRIEPNLWHIECDQTQIQQVIVNLCRNAIEAMPAGGRLTIVAENVTLASPLNDSHPPLTTGEYACVTVEDTGCGFDAETKKLIFDPFFTTKERGHGLGLPAAYGIIGAHGGAITAASELGKGSTFRMWLPRARSPKTRAATQLG